MVKKWVWPVWSGDSKSGFVSRMNRWNEQFFAYWQKFRKAKNITMISIGGCAYLIHETLKSVLS